MYHKVLQIFSIFCSCTNRHVKQTLCRPIGMARASLSLSQFTFGHEVGHILGCSHNIEQTPNPFVSYGVGYLIPNTNERTIMA